MTPKMSAWNALGNPQMACPSWLCIILGLCIPHCHLVRLFELNLAFFRTFFLKSHDAMSIKSAHLGVKMNCFKKPVFRNENRTLCNSPDFETGISRESRIGIVCKKKNRLSCLPWSGLAREFRTAGPAPRAPRAPAGPGHPRGGIPRPGGAPGGPCWPGALDIENAPHKPL